MLDFPAIVESIIVFTVIGIVSLRFKLLNPSGILASLFIGFLILVFGGFEWLTILLVFFAIAMFFTKFKFGYRERFLFNGEIRTWRNVFANGGVAASFAIVEGLMPLDLFMAGFLGAISTAAADTLGTELGLLYPHNPRLITNLNKEVPTGTSGGISPLGEVAMLWATFVIALAAWILGVHPAKWSISDVLIVVIVSGVIGGTIDSVIGATVQGIYKCSVCGKPTDNLVHCSKPSIYIKGIRAMDNDAVNFLSTLIGAVIAISLIL